MPCPSEKAWIAKYQCARKLTGFGSVANELPEDTMDSRDADWEDTDSEDEESDLENLKTTEAYQAL